MKSLLTFIFGVFLLMGAGASTALAEAGSAATGTNSLNAANTSSTNVGKLIPSATFFQLDESSCPWLPGGKKMKWNDIVAYASSLKYDTIIIQHVQLAPYRDLFKPADYKSTANVPTDDPVENIFRAADANSMKVYLGLRNDLFTTDSGNYTDKKSLSDWLTKMGDSEVSTIDVLNNTYGYHSSFAGWYIPTEFYAFTYPGNDDRTVAVANFLNRIATECKKKKNVPVAASMFRGDYFDDKPENYSQLSKTYVAVLNDSNVDELLVQDQIGEVGNTCAGLSAVYAALQSACSQSTVRKSVGNTRVSFTPLVELFQRDGNNRFPAHINRIRKQLDLANSAKPTNRIATFDYLNYQNPVSSADENSATSNSATPVTQDAASVTALTERRRLFTDYQVFSNPYMQPTGCDGELTVSSRSSDIQY